MSRSERSATVWDERTCFVGIDWGVEEHRLYVLDAQAQVRGDRRVPHRAADVADAMQWLVTLAGGDVTRLAVAIERPRGVLIDALLERGVAVYALNPKQLDRFRDRFTASGAKDDSRDAHVLSDALRTDARAFRRVQADAPEIIHLRELTRMVEELQVERGRLASRLREQLYRVDAAWLALCPAADEPWVWTLLRDTPHPDGWTALARRHLTPALRAHRIRRFSVDELLTALRSPRLQAAPGVADAVATRIASLVPQLILLEAQRRRAEHQIEGMLEALAGEADPPGQPREHRDAAILLSLPGAGRMVSATMLAEAAGLLADRDYHTLRLYGGVGPVTRRSGKRLRTVQMRYACNGRLRQALYHWARTSVQHDQRARVYYDSLRARGHAHARALRSVADRWLRILVGMLRTRTLYNREHGTVAGTAA